MRKQPALAYFRCNSTLNGRVDNLPHQQRAVASYARRHKLRIVGEHLDIVKTDWGLARLLATLCKRPEIKAVIVADADTLDAGDRHTALSLLAARGVRVLTASGDDLTAQAA